MYWNTKKAGSVLCGWHQISSTPWHWVRLPYLPVRQSLFAQSLFALIIVRPEPCSLYLNFVHNPHHFIKMFISYTTLLFKWLVIFYFYHISNCFTSDNYFLHFLILFLQKDIIGLIVWFDLFIYIPEHNTIHWSLNEI